MKVEAVQGKQVSLEWNETPGGLWHIERTEGFICCRDRERQISRAKNTEPSNIKYFLEMDPGTLTAPM